MVVRKLKKNQIFIACFWTYRADIGKFFPFFFPFLLGRLLRKKIRVQSYAFLTFSSVLKREDCQSLFHKRFREIISTTLFSAEAIAEACLIAQTCDAISCVVSLFFSQKIKFIILVLRNHIFSKSTKVS